MHIPVLLQEVVSGLAVDDGQTVLDCTVGSGGHALAICQAADRIRLVGLDADRQALARTERTLSKVNRSELILVPTYYRYLTEVLDELRIEKVDRILFDLGMSSDQLSTSGRGFSFSGREPLVMTFKDQLEPGDLTAEEVVNDWQPESLEAIFSGYGEEKRAWKIVEAIVQARQVERITTADQLAEIIRQAVPPRIGQKIHPATRTFQALRIVVNDELEGLRSTLPKALDRLSAGGRMAIISFHSLEDRIVKRYFHTWEREGRGQRLTKKPIRPTTREVEYNPKARSARLRIFKKSSNF